MAFASPWQKQRTSAKWKGSRSSRRLSECGDLPREKLTASYARLDRPHSEIAPWSIWISYSPDLRLWGQSELIAGPTTGTDRRVSQTRWLSIYHGVFRTMESVYLLGVALHDLLNPAKIIGVGDSSISAAGDPWEITGIVHNVACSPAALPVCGTRWNREDLLGRCRHGHVCRRSECLRPRRVVPGSRQAAKMSVEFHPKETEGMREISEKTCFKIGIVRQRLLRSCSGHSAPASWK